MIPLLPKWHLMPNRPSFYDTDSATLLELASTLHATMNSLIEDYNKFVDSTNKAITEFMQSETKNREVFEVAIRQEFQDFINTVDLKIAGFSAEMSNFKNSAESTINGMQATLNATINNLDKIAEETLQDAINAGQITIIESYNDETESLQLAVTGEV